MLADTSTDIIPVLLIFYYIVKSTLTPGWYKDQALFAFLVPVTMVTFKLSVAVFCLAIIPVFIFLLKNRDKKKILFILSISFFAVLFWCVRNVIITGYLVYPISGIDLFSFDWKMPATTLMLQKTHVYEWAKIVFEVHYIDRLSLFFSAGITGAKMTLISRLTEFCLFVFVVLSPLLVTWYMLKKKKGIKNSYYVYFVSLVCILSGMILAPDLRFSSGYIFGAAFFVFNLIIVSVKKERFPAPKTGKAMLVFTLLSFMLITIDKYQRIPAYFRFSATSPGFVKSIAVHPWQAKPQREYTPYRMENITVYLTHKYDVRTFDTLPSANPMGIPFQPFTGNKVQNIKTVEARGESIQDGFRTKKEYLVPIENNADAYKTLYYFFIKDQYLNELVNNRKY